MTYMRTPRYDSAGNVYHYGAKAPANRCHYEGCRNTKWASWDYCMSHGR